MRGPVTGLIGLIAALLVGGGLAYGMDDRIATLALILYVALAVTIMRRDWLTYRKEARDAW